MIVYDSMNQLGRLIVLNENVTLSETSELLNVNQSLKLIQKNFLFYI
jgi:hypothetical protein